MRHGLEEHLWSIFFLKKDFIYLFLEKGERWEKERERNINVWLPLTHPLLGTWPAAQACTLTRNRTGDPLVHRPTCNPLNHTTQGKYFLIWCAFFWVICFKIITLKFYPYSYYNLCSKVLFNKIVGMSMFLL